MQKQRSRRPAGTIVTHNGPHGTTYAARFSADGKRRFVTLGSSADGFTRRRPRRGLANILADVCRGIWTAPTRKRPIEGPVEEPLFAEFASRWFAAIKQEVRASTAEAYAVT